MDWLMQFGYEKYLLVGNPMRYDIVYACEDMSRGIGESRSATLCNTNEENQSTEGVKDMLNAQRYTREQRHQLHL